MWGIYVAGGYGSLGDDTGGQSVLTRVKTFIRKMRGYKRAKVARPWLSGVWHDIPAYQDVKHLVDFFTVDGPSYWKMESRNDLVRRGHRVYVLADVPHEYVVYTATGAPFEIELPEEELAYFWYDPTSGERKGEGMVNGSEQKEFIPPIEGDAVLYIFRSKQKSK